MRQLIPILIAATLLVLLTVSVNSAQNEASSSRGYLTTPQELRNIAEKANAGLEPYQSAVKDVLDWAEDQWDFDIDADTRCGGSANRPRWIDERGASRVYSKALAYHLTGDEKYAEEVKDIIEKIIEEVETITLREQQCRLNFSWGTPEYVAAADLIEDYWRDMTCTGPESTIYNENELTEGNCKYLFQNWLIKNPYYVISHSAYAQSNWGAAATNATAYIADYLWDRPGVKLRHRLPPELAKGEYVELTPEEAYLYATERLFDRLNGYGVDHDSSSSCDFMEGRQQDRDYTPVKSQITELGIITEDARREEECNIPEYNGKYQNYPQVHINNTVQQCELMLRRGDSTCFDNIDMTNIPEYTFIGSDGKEKVTHLYPGRGSIERAINAIIVDSDTEWRHDDALYVAYRYYLNNSRFGHVDAWVKELDRGIHCSQGICFAGLTHAFSDGEVILPPPVVPRPGLEEITRADSQG